VKATYVDAEEFKADLLERVSQFVDTCIKDNEMYEVEGIVEIVTNGAVSPEFIFEDVKEFLSTYNMVKQDIESLGEDNDPEMREMLSEQASNVHSSLINCAVVYIREKGLSVTPEELVKYWFTYGYGNP